MKSKIVSCCIFEISDSTITVLNPDKTSVEFRTPSSGKCFDDKMQELTTLANAYIAAFTESHPQTPSIAITSQPEPNIILVESAA